MTRARDSFADLQIRGQYAEQGRWNARRDALSQVGAPVNEPSSSSLSSQLNKYWQSWQQLANSPSDSASRVSVIQQGQALAQEFNPQSGPHHQPRRANRRSFHRLRRLPGSATQQLKQQQTNLDSRVGLTPTNINDYANQISQINKQISQVEAGGMHANDLRDQRDELMDKLSQLVKFTSTESADGQVSLYINGHQLVDRDRVNQLVANPSPGPWTTVTWQSDGSTLLTTNVGGRLHGLTEARDVDVQDQLNQLNQLASRVSQSVNSLHT